jgi:hypothetical protein
METENKKYQRPQITVKCDNPDCGRIFKKDGSEVRRNAKRGSKNYCQKSCSSKANVKNLLDSDKHGEGKNIGYVKIDKYTGLREHLRRVKNRAKDNGKFYDITLDDLLDQWIKQKGICVYTGIELTHPKKGNEKSLIYTASLDRIDSSIGYVKGNIQFISAAANMAKNNMTHEQMVEFCKLICKNWSTPQYSTLI